MAGAKLNGILAAHYAKGKKAFSFEYDRGWIKSEQQLLLDPDIQFYEIEADGLYLETVLKYLDYFLMTSF